MESNRVLAKGREICGAGSAALQKRQVFLVAPVSSLVTMTEITAMQFYRSLGKLSTLCNFPGQTILM